MLRPNPIRPNVVMDVAVAVNTDVALVVYIANVLAVLNRNLGTYMFDHDWQQRQVL